MKLLLRFVIIFCLSSSIVSCNHGSEIQSSGEVQLDLQTIPGNSNGRLLNVLLNDADAVFLTIVHSDGLLTEYSLTEINLYQIDGDYISQKISLPVGDYIITEFLVIDSDGNIRYITPQEVSSQAQNVTDPLPISFSVAADEITDVAIEVISTQDLSLEDFGLAGFNLTEIDLFSFLINVSEKGNSDLLLDAQVTISSDTYTFTKELLAIANNSLVIKDGYATYNLTVRHDGYNDFSYTFSRDSLAHYSSTPLTIELTLEGWNPGENWIDSRDNIIYKTVQIGDQIWMAENLKATSLTDGTPIEQVVEQDDWIVSNGASYSWHSNDEGTYGEYGVLYNWYAVETEKLCPTSWHVASEDEWLTLIEHVGGSEVAGGMLKESGNDHWIAPNTAATNEFDFTSLPGGSRHDYSTLAEFVDTGKFGYWWTATESTETEAKNFGMLYSVARIDSHSYGKRTGSSVRCIKD